MSDNRMTGQVIVVTGASSGLGRAIAIDLAGRGAHVVATARSTDRLAATVVSITEVGGSAQAIPCDVTSAPDVHRLFTEVDRTHERIDALVNNAGIVAPAAIDEMTTENWRTVIDVNLTGPFLCTREVFAIMKRNGGGRILNIGSISAAVPRPNSANYAASKAGLTGLTRATAIEGRPHGIAAGCLHPGNVATEMRLGEAPEGAEGWNTEPMMTTEQVARTAASMLNVEQGTTAYELTILPIEQDFLGRG
jgi:NAD(P)-dependent dehydrogenase (short-subunit alcohol dehydrogenase family)